MKNMEEWVGDGDKTQIRELDVPTITEGFIIILKDH